MRILIYIIVIFALVGTFFWRFNQKTPQKNPQKTSVQSAAVENNPSPFETYIFVPYWTIDKDVSFTPYENLIYFGVSVNQSGVDHEDQGYKALPSFLKEVGSKKSYLAVRMLNQDANLAILKDRVLQDKIATEAVHIARENNFSGIILDFETQGLPFESFIKSITSLNSLFAQKAHGQKLSFGTLVYGDVFYRIRPFDVESIAKSSDRVFVMAYDFSKAKGDPGPNFPLDDKKTYGYDFKTMVSDYGKVVPKNKLSFIFGMFGYDWIIDAKNQTKGTADSKSTLGFEQFLGQCVPANSCKVENNDGYGVKISYDKDQENHLIFFETNESVAKKKEYLNSQGLNSFGYWAYSFF
ncbi:MAG: glycosyl hydrolase family 18 protein [Candidatus Levyibacteriota bacterium]